MPQPLSQQFANFLRDVSHILKLGKHGKLKPQLRRFLERVVDSNGHTSVETILATRPDGAACPDLCHRLRQSPLMQGSAATRAAMMSCRSFQQIVALAWLGHREVEAAAVPPLLRTTAATDVSGLSGSSPAVIAAAAAATQVPPLLRSTAAPGGLVDDDGASWDQEGDDLAVATGIASEGGSDGEQTPPGSPVVSGYAKDTPDSAIAVVLAARGLQPAPMARTVAPSGGGGGVSLPPTLVRTTAAANTTDLTGSSAAVIAAAAAYDGPPARLIRQGAVRAQPVPGKEKLDALMAGVWQAAEEADAANADGGAPRPSDY